MDKIRASLVAANKKSIDDFFNALKKRLGRRVTRVVILPLYGKANEFPSIEDAVAFIDRHQPHEGSTDFRKYEIRVEFSNSDKVEALLEAKEKVREFLEFVARQ